MKQWYKKKEGKEERQGKKSEIKRQGKEVVTTGMGKGKGRGKSERVEMGLKGLKGEEKGGKYSKMRRVLNAHRRYHTSIEGRNRTRRRKGGKRGDEKRTERKGEKYTMKRGRREESSDG